MVLEDALASVMIQVVQGYLTRTKELTPKTPRAALGWFGATIEKYASNPEILRRCKAALSIAIGFPVEDLDVSEFVHIDTLAFDTGTSRQAVLESLISLGRLADCSSRADDLFVPIDLAWELTSY